MAMLPDIVGRIRMDTSQAEASMLGLGASTRALESQARVSSVGMLGSFQTFAKISTTIYVLKQALDHLLGPTIEIGRSFESAMYKMKVAADLTGEQFKQVSDYAKQLGNDITLPGVNADDAANSMMEMSRAGMDLTNTMAAAPAVLALAKMAEMDVGDAAKLTAKMLNTFNLEGKDAQMIADDLARAAQRSSAEMEELAYGLSSGASVWDMTNQSAGDMITALAMLSDNMVEGEEAGTALKTMMMRLIKPAGDGADLMEKYGMEVYDANGKFKDFRSLVEMFSTSLAGLTNEQKDEALATIFGTKAIKGAALILANGTGAWDDYNNSVTHGLTAQEILLAQMTPFEQAIERVKNAIANFQIGQWVDSMAPFFTAAMNNTMDFIGKLDQIKTNLDSGVDFKDSWVGVFAEDSYMTHMIINLDKIKDSLGGLWDKAVWVKDKFGEVFGGIDLSAENTHRVIDVVVGFIVARFVIMAAQAVITSVTVVASWVAQQVGAIISVAIQMAQVAYLIIRWAAMAGSAAIYAGAVVLGYETTAGASVLSSLTQIGAIAKIKEAWIVFQAWLAGQAAVNGALFGPGAAKGGALAGMSAGALGAATVTTGGAVGAAYVGEKYIGTPPAVQTLKEAENLDKEAEAMPEGPEKDAKVAEAKAKHEEARQQGWNVDDIGPLKDKIYEKFWAIHGMLTDTWEKIWNYDWGTKIDEFKTTISEKFWGIHGAITDGLGDGAGAVGDFFGGINDSIDDWLEVLPERMKDLGHDIAVGVWNGFLASIHEIIYIGVKIAWTLWENRQEIYDTGKNLFWEFMHGLASSPKVITLHAIMVVQDFCNGLGDAKQQIFDAGSAVKNWLWDGFVGNKASGEKAWGSYLNDFWGFVTNSFNFFWNVGWTVIEWVFDSFTSSSELIDSAIGWVVDSFWAILTGRMPDFGAMGWGIGGWIWDGMSNVAGWLGDRGNELWAAMSSAIWDATGGHGPDLRAIGWDMAKGIWDGMKDVGSWIERRKDELWEAFKGAVMSAFNMQSPSKRMMPLGVLVGEGLIMGIISTADGAKAAVEGVFGSMKDAAYAFVKKGLISVRDLPGLFGFGGGGGGNTAFDIGGGVEQWRSTVVQALNMLGMPLEWADITLAQIQSESSGNPNAYNDWDSNAMLGLNSGGLLQNVGQYYQGRLPADYLAANPNTNMYDPLGSILAGLRYMVDQYGSPYGVWGEGHGYAGGGISLSAGMAEVSAKGPELHLTKDNIEEFGLSTPTVNITFEAGMEWLKDFVKVEFDGMAQTAINKNHSMVR